jgi:hypothetical protein
MTGQIGKRSSMQTLGLAVVSVSLIMATGMARAEDDGRTMSEKISDGFYGVIRNTNMDNRGIDYRERSPLVVPPTLDLPPPSSAAADGQIANWPKDPDERSRKAVIAAKKKNAPPVARVQVNATGGAAQAQAINIAPPIDAQPDAAAGTARPSYANDRNGTARVDPIYDKSGDLFTGGASDLVNDVGLGNLFGTSGKTMPVEPGTEPSRQALTQPPPGYQTPSATYAYGERKKGWFDGTASPDRNPLAQKSSASSMVQ